MKVITSQNYFNEDIVNSYINDMLSSGITEITLPVIPVYYDDLYILVDGHHRYMAAKSINININFEIVEDEKTYYEYIDSKNSDEILKAWIQSAPFSRPSVHLSRPSVLPVACPSVPCQLSAVGPVAPVVVPCRAYAAGAARFYLYFLYLSKLSCIYISYIYAISLISIIAISI